MTKRVINIDGNKYQLVEKEKSTTHVYAILDRSGSMTGLEKSTIEGYNAFIDKLRGENARVTTVLFDDQYEILEKNRRIAAIPKLTKETYFTRGGTALIDAFCKTLTGEELPKGDRALVIVITDGEENMSREYKTTDMKKLVETLTGTGYWTFTYLGANQDAWGVAQNYGFKAGNVSSYNATDVGTRSAYSVTTASLGNFTAQSASQTDSFFSREDQDELKKAK